MGASKWCFQFSGGCLGLGRTGYMSITLSLLKRRNERWRENLENNRIVTQPANSRLIDARTWHRTNKQALGELGWGRCAFSVQ